MNNFSISQLEQFSGIKAHTIRIWEQRYNALQPTRSEGNTRYYDNAQLKRLLNIVNLLQADHKVSEVCRMKDAELFRLNELQLKNMVADNKTADYFISQFIVASMNYEESSLDKLFIKCEEKFGLKNTYLKVIHPMLNRIGLMWLNDSLQPEQEHFTSNFIRKKLFSAIDDLPSAKSSKGSWLLFLPEDEFHEIGLLFANYIIKAAGFKVTYLGSNVPLITLKKAVEDIDPDHLLLFLVHSKLPENSQQYLKVLKQNFKNKKICLSGNSDISTQIKIDKGIQWIYSVDQLEEMLKSYK